MNRRNLFVLVVMLLTISLTACGSGAGGPGPRTWIDAPLDGSILELGPVVVRSHAASEGGTTQATLIVNGAQVRVDQAVDTSSPLIEFAQTWIPDQPGVYIVQVISMDAAGNEGRSNSVRVQVGERTTSETATPTPTTATPTPATLTPTVTVVSAPTFTLGQNANCREGDSTGYEVVTSLLKDQQVVIDGRNSNNSWFWVLIPNSSEHCWVSASTGIPAGPYTSTQVIVPLPLPVTATFTPVANPPSQFGQFNVSTKSCTAFEYIVRLEWDDTDGEDGYQIYRDGNLIATVGADSTIYDDPSPDYNAHSYQVQAYNGSGTSSSPAKNSEGCVY